MTHERKPIFAATPLVGVSQTICNGIEERFTIEVPGSLMRSIIAACTGERTLDSIVQELSKAWDRSTLIDLFEVLFARGVLVDSPEFLGAVWKAVRNPAAYPQLITAEAVDQMVDRAVSQHRAITEGGAAVSYEVCSSSLLMLFERRRSVRSYSGQPLSQLVLIDLLWSLYGEVRSTKPTEQCKLTVPSAGALYPLDLRLVLFDSVGELRPAVYRIRYPSAEQVRLERVSGDVYACKRAFLDPLMLEGATGVIVVNGTFSSVAAKYGNRGMLYVSLEAGHVAQNAHLVAAARDVSTIEIGGFTEVLLSKAICLPDSHVPLTTIVFGTEGQARSAETIETDWVVPLAGDYMPPFSVALARFDETHNDDWSYGRDADPKLALVKAEAEAREWAACGFVPEGAVHASYDELPNAVDPRTVIGYHPAQYRITGFPFSPFDPSTAHTWVPGESERGAVYVLGDLVHFPYESSNPYAYANSSGVAAHPERETAIQTGVLELIERDAFMNAYLCRLPARRIAPGTLPVDLQIRAQAIERLGFTIHFLDHTLDLAPVVFIYAQSDERHYFTCAACSRFDAYEAAEHALMEVEASVLARLQNGPSAAVTPKEVSMPQDHGALYEQPRYFRRAEFMAAKGDVRSFRMMGEQGAHTWGELMDRITRLSAQLITVPLNIPQTRGGNNGLHIIRSVVPGLVPMTFGYGQIPGGMRRIAEIARTFAGKEMTYRDLPRFPHPFA